MKNFKNMNVNAVTGKKIQIHNKEYYLEKIRYVEQTTETLKNEICAYFENKEKRKNTKYIPNERLQNLAIYAMYNGGLTNMSIQDLEYIWTFLK